jgi:hypothetical protein
MVAVAAVVSQPRGRRWRRVRRLRRIRRARRGLKFVGVVASRRTARVAVVVDGRSLRAVEVTSTAADKTGDAKHGTGDVRDSEMQSPRISGERPEPLGPAVGPNEQGRR